MVGGLGLIWINPITPRLPDSNALTPAMARTKDVNAIEKIASKNGKTAIQGAFSIKFIPVNSLPRVS